jgi:cobalt/nickel transport system permease protein
MKVSSVQERTMIVSGFFYAKISPSMERKVKSMHMADALVSPAVGGALIAVSGAALCYAAIKGRKEQLLDEKKVPVMGIMSAFVFAGQMINFTIPGTGSSGHIGGGILLAALLGGGPALLCLAAVLLIQCLIFADGGLLALGCNIFNMGVIPCLVIYPLLYRPIIKKGMTKKNITIASVLSVVVGLQLGAFSVVLETLASGITQLPLGSFLLLMQPIHLAIGIVEGIVTAAVLVYVNSAQPEILQSAQAAQPLRSHLSMKKVLAVLGVLTLLVGGGLSLFASSYPDGLEWSVDGVLRKNEPAIGEAGGLREVTASGAVYDAASGIQEATSLMPDYAFKGSDSTAGTSAAGIFGSLAVMLLAGGVGLFIARAKKKPLNSR